MSVRKFCTEVCLHLKKVEGMVFRSTDEFGRVVISHSPVRKRIFGFKQDPTTSVVCYKILLILGAWGMDPNKQPKLAIKDHIRKDLLDQRIVAFQ